MIRRTDPVIPIGRIFSRLSNKNASIYCVRCSKIWKFGKKFLYLHTKQIIKVNR